MLRRIPPADGTIQVDLGTATAEPELTLRRDVSGDEPPVLGLQPTDDTSTTDDDTAG